MTHGIYPVSLARLYLYKVGQQWVPSNGTEGSIFQDSWCCQCQRDGVMNGTADSDVEENWCSIIAASYRGEAKEWQYDASGQPCCTSFQPLGADLRDEWDKFTPDLFA